MLNQFFITNEVNVRYILIERHKLVKLLYSSYQLHIISTSTTMPQPFHSNIYFHGAQIKIQIIYARLFAKHTHDNSLKKCS